ncbi:LysM peptidoglycan-binding domain-containing protein [Longirhabdus pacifica]|uniref:LysM peptidoglycan-binding domain-containing protein n=1 Tax=Longirhabdus pacifica TaxID=2305227 RepID=UPI0010091A24|nr:LysM peptidoglycan-binding domain-containing protein [Longirhabdus pacifica]
MYVMTLNEVQLPVTPSKFTLKIANENKTVSMLETGEINLLRTPGLSEITFDALIPHTEYPFAVYPDGFKDQTYYTEHFKALKQNKMPFPFTYVRQTPQGKPLFDNIMQVSLEEYTWKEDAKNGFDIIISVKLKEYRQDATILVKNGPEDEDGTPTATLEEQRPAKEPAASYTVQAGDTLWSICKKELGDGAKYKEIASLNGIKNANLIYPGQVIRFA